MVKKARESDALTLTARKARTTLADHVVVAFGKFQDKVVGAGKPRGSDDLLHGCGRVRKGDVIADAAVEQEVLLQHDADLAAQPRRVDRGKVHSVDEDAAALGHVEALNEACQRALAGAGRADDADDLSRGNVQIDSLEDFRSIDAVAERHPLERHGAADRRQRRARGVEAWFRRRVEDVAEPLDGKTGLVEILPHLSEPQNRRADPAGEHVEGDELADGEVAGDDKSRAEVKDCGG